MKLGGGECHRYRDRGLAAATADPAAEKRAEIQASENLR